MTSPKIALNSKELRPIDIPRSCRPSWASFAAAEDAQTPGRSAENRKDKDTGETNIHWASQHETGPTKG